MRSSETMPPGESTRLPLAVAALQIIVGVFTPLALSSVGGVGIYSAPILLPLLWITANATRGVGRWYFTVLGSLVAAETAWAVSWSLAPDLQLLLPIIAATITAALFLRTWGRDLPGSTTVLIIAALGLLGIGGIAALALSGETTTREASFDASDKN